MKNIRTSMKAEAGSLKNWVDDVISENLEHIHRIEKTILGILKSQETTYADYIAYLWKLSTEFPQNLSWQIKNYCSRKFQKSKPYQRQPVPPVFTDGQFTKNDVAKILGRVNVPNTEPEIRKIQSMDVQEQDLIRCQVYSCASSWEGKILKYNEE